MSIWRPRTGLRIPHITRARTLDEQYIPSIGGGLLLNMPLREHTRPIFSAGAATGFSTETVDADGTFKHYHTGLITGATVNTARIEPHGVLVEGARTNLMLRSEEHCVDGSGNPWLWTAAVCTANQAVAPDGNTTAEKMAETTDNSAHFCAQLVAITVAAYTYSVYVKKGAGRDWVVLVGEVPPTAAAWFDIANGTVGTVSGGASPSGRITDIGSGWYRCQLTWTGTTADNVYAYVGLADSDGSLSYVGDTGKYVYIWGSQCELGAFASSYIPTTTATVQRGVDHLRIDNTSEVHCKAAAGTFCAAFTPHWSGAPAQYYRVLDAQKAGDEGVVVSTVIDEEKMLLWVQNDAGVNQAFIEGAWSFVADEPHIVTAVWDTNRFELYRDGVLIGEDTSGTPDTINTSLAIGHHRITNGFEPFADIAHLLIYSDAKSATDIGRISAELTRWIA
jgi:hypothetical protein